MIGLTNEEGQIYQSYRYSVFGEITFGTPQYENEYTYNGESYNPNIKSQYLRARYYCVVTADFLTEDSYLGRITEPLTLNRYNYCVGNPLNYVDPSGNIPEWLKNILDLLFGDDGEEPTLPVAYPIPPTPTPEPSKDPTLETSLPETKVESDISNAEENSMIKYVSGDDIYNEYYYFRNVNATEYVTKEMLEAVGWGVELNDGDIKLYNAVLETFGITSGRSIRMFFATLIAESNGVVLEKRSDESCRKLGYTANTRGAGYIQITHDYTHDSFLKYLADNYYSEDEAFNSYYGNLANTVTYKDYTWIFGKTQSDNDTATVIGNNWAMTSAAWYWTGPQLWRYYKNNDTGEEEVNNGYSKDLNLYAQGDNGDNSEYKESEGLFLITQYYVNGWRNAIGEDKPYNDDYKYVASTGKYKILTNGNVEMYEHEYLPPGNLQRRMDAYMLICEKWGKDW